MIPLEGFWCSDTWRWSPRKERWWWMWPFAGPACSLMAAHDWLKESLIAIGIRGKERKWQSGNLRMVIAPSLSFFLTSIQTRARSSIQQARYVEFREVPADPLGSKGVLSNIWSGALEDKTVMLGLPRQMQLNKSFIIYSDTKVPEVSQQCKRLRVSRQICTISK